MNTLVAKAKAAHLDVKALVSKTDGAGCTPLFYAHTPGTVMAWLEAGTDPFQKDKGGVTAEDYLKEYAKNLRKDKHPGAQDAEDAWILLHDHIRQAQEKNLKDPS